MSARVAARFLPKPAPPPCATPGCPLRAPARSTGGLCGNCRERATRARMKAKRLATMTSAERAALK